MKTYYDEVKSEAKDFMEYYQDEITEIIEKNRHRDNEYIFMVICNRWELKDKIHEWLDEIWYLFLTKKCFKTGGKFLNYAVITEKSEKNKEGKKRQESIKTETFFIVKYDLFLEIRKIIMEIMA